ncbi:MAG: type II toxin-antitoxin system HicA family toxin [Spirochaetota bacterium]
MKRNKFLKYLNSHNCQITKEGSKHTIVENLNTGKKTTLPRHNNIEYFTIISICKQLGIAIPKER